MKIIEEHENWGLAVQDWADWPHSIKHSNCSREDLATFDFALKEHGLELEVLGDEEFAAGQCELFRVVERIA